MYAFSVISASDVLNKTVYVQLYVRPSGKADKMSWTNLILQKSLTHFQYSSQNRLISVAWEDLN